VIRGTASALLLLLLGAAPVTSNATPLEITVSILPQREFVEQIGGDLVEVQVLVPPGQSPATYEPTPRQITRLASSALWIRIGVAFERSLIPKVREAAPDTPIIDGRRGIELETLAGISSDTADHHGRYDPHFWLDPERVGVHAVTVRDALAEILPGRRGELDANLVSYRRDLEAVDRRVASALEPLTGRTLLVFHPAYGYFARRYGLVQMAVERGGKEPTTRQLAQLLEEARAAHIPALFVQPQFSGRSAHAIAEALGVHVIELDPLAPDHLANLDRMARRILEVYGYWE
jgi:zinc transport system substrate-binding protein